MLRRNDARWAYLLVNLATLLWSSNIVLGRVLRDYLGPVTIACARFTVAGLVLLALLLVEQKNSPHLQGATTTNLFPKRGQDWLLSIAMGICGVFGFTILLYLALRYTTASRAALINAASPLITAVLAAVFLKERFTLPMLGGALLSLIGVTWVIGIGSKDLLQSPQILLGDLICLGTSALWGGYSILARLATRNRSSLQATAHAVWVMLPLFFAAAWLEWHSAPPQLTGLVILALVYIGIFPSVIAFAAWTEGVRRAGPNQAMAFYNMLPVYGALLGVLLLGESLGWSTLVGGGLVLAGGMVTALYRT